MRIVQPEGRKGSLKWIQRAIERRPDLLRPEALAEIRWLSPLRADEFAEYRDASFLRLVGLERLETSLKAFWPARGPQWDALGLAGDMPVLVETKAQVAEMLSPPSQASPNSLARIAAAFAETQAALGASPETDWTIGYYQLANRIAHLWWLHNEGVPAHLLLVGFVGDSEMNGPADASEWASAFATAARSLGLPARHFLSDHIHHVHPDVARL